MLFGVALAGDLRTFCQRIPAPKSNAFPLPLPGNVRLSLGGTAFDSRPGFFKRTIGQSPLLPPGTFPDPKGQRLRKSAAISAKVTIRTPE
jgi:hypothetical protein